ncbi:hypothetical protein ACTFIV_006440 [Dictyostelium citrinum]
MHELYKQVFNNKFLRYKIFSHITEHNKENRNIRYNYYDFPFELVLETKNQQLLNEKLNNYNKYFNNKNNNKFKNIEKHYLNFNKSCLMNLFEWEELPLELFEFIFKTFEKEIKGMKALINSREVVTLPYFVELIRNHSLDKIKFLIENEYLDVMDIEKSLIFVCQRLFYKDNITSSGKVVAINKSTKKEQIKTKKIKLFNYLFKEIKVSLPTQKIVSMLMDVVYKDQIENYGEMLINQLPDQLPANDGFNLNRLDHFTTFTSLLITRNIWPLFNLLLNKYKVELPNTTKTTTTTTSSTATIKQSNKIMEEEIVIINNIPIKLKTLKCLQFNPSVILNKCSNLELVKVLLKSFPEIYLNPVNFGNTKVISYPNIALYLVENHFKIISLFDFSISWPCYYKLHEMGSLSLVSLPVMQYYSDDPQFKELIENDICIIQQLPNSLHEASKLIKPLMKLDDLMVVKQFLLKFPRNYTFKIIKRLVLSIQSAEVTTTTTDEIIKNKRIEILNFLKEHLLAGNYPYFHAAKLKEEICSLLIFSIEQNERELFEVVLVLLNQFQKQEDYSVFYSSLSGWIRRNQGIARKWLLYSSFNTFFNDIVKEDLASLLNNKTHKYRNLNFSDSKFVIGELTSRDPSTEPFNCSIDSILTIRSNIIHYGLMNDIIFSSNNNHQKVEFFQMANEKIIKPFYDKGFIRNLLLHNFSWLEKIKGDSFFFNKVLYKLFDFGYIKNDNIKNAIQILNSINKSQLADNFYLSFNKGNNATNVDQFDKILNLFKEK